MRAAVRQSSSVKRSIRFRIVGEDWTGMLPLIVSLYFSDFSPGHPYEDMAL